MATMSRRLFCLFAILFIFSATFSPTFATELTVFGPTQYVRTTGPPNVYTNNFSAFQKEGKLIIENGDDDGKHRVTSALIFINGVQVFAPDDFKQQIYLMEAPVILSDNNNSILVELRSKPGTYLTIRLIQEAEPPTVAMSADPDTLPADESSTLSWTSTYADSCVIEPGIGSVEVSGSIPVSPTETTTYTITATGPGGTATDSVTVTVVYPPSITIVEPDGVNDSTDCSFTIQWTDDDHDDNATISLYYDTDNSGADGTLIVSGLSEDPDEAGDQYQWDTTSIAEGDYYVYAVIDDGVNDPVVDYSEGVLNIDHIIPDEIKLTASDAASYDYFGNAVSISGDYAIVGAGGDDDNGSNSGSAYILKRECHSWIEHAKLTAGDGAEYDYFGYSVSISGDYAIVGATYDDDGGSDSGSAYIFKRDDDLWTEQAKLTASDGAEYDYFGYSVSISGDYAIVGATYDDDGGSDSGSAYIFKRNGDAWVEQAKLTASDADEGYQFGWSVSINGDYAIVSALGDEVYEENINYSGSVYIFRREGDAWVEQVKLFATGTANEYRFGYSVAINDSYAVVGAVGQYSEVPLPGAVYIFKREGTTWVEQAKVTADNPFGGDNFGISVSIDENYAVVGALGDGEYEPATAHIFQPEGDSWLYRFKLTPSEGGGNYHGFSVAINGDYAIVGAPGDYDEGEQAGAAYIYPIANYAKTPFISLVEPDGIDDIADCSFTIQWADADLDDNATISLYYDDDNSGADGTLIISGLSEDPDGPDNEYVWDTTGIEKGTYYIYAVIDDGNNDPVVDYSKGVVYVHTIYSINKITASDAAAYDSFGDSVSISGDYAIVGADGDEYYSGSAYVFKREGDLWVEQVKLTASDPAAWDYFGDSVSMSGDYAIVGASGDDDGGSSSGSALIFKREGDLWVEQVKLIASDAAAYDYFGTSVAIYGSYTIVGASGDDDGGSGSGSAYIFKRDDDLWTEQAKLTASDAAAYDNFGGSVSINGDYAIVGSRYDDDAGSSSGAAYIFQRDGSGWTQHTKLTASDAASYDNFGNSVSINGEYAIVGSRFDDDSAYNSGSTYIFKREGDVWVELFKLTAGDRKEYAYFGSAVSIDNGSLIVGASGNDTGGDQSGSAYIYSIAPGYIRANPGIISIGESTTVSWSFPNTTLVTIDNGIGQVPAIGSTTVILDETTTYTITAVGCWGTETDSVTVRVPPTVEISADPAVTNLGESSTLTWTSTNAVSCVIEPDIGSVEVSGSITVSPTETTTYIITATGPGGTATASVTVTIAAPIVSISADPEIINLGESTTLTWSSTNATSCSIEPAIGSVDVNGSVSVAPGQNTTYTITATGPGGTATASVTLTYFSPTVDLSANPETIILGESSTLTWTSTNATSCVIEPGIGSVEVTGSIAVSPITPTTYTITATGPGGTATATATISIAEPTVTIGADPETIPFTESSTLTWSSTSAVSCVIEPDVGGVATTGSTTLSPSETTTYTITASGPGGTATASVTVTVTYPVPIIDISAEPEVINIGSSSTLTWSTTYADSISIDQEIGPVDPSGSTTVSPTETTTYTITATGPGGTATDSVTVTVFPSNISITSPLDGETISQPDIMVEGTITNPLGNELRVKVNDTGAIAYGDQFVANHVPLEEGENSITTTVIDAEGNIASASITVYAETTDEYIIIIAHSDSGISPLETGLTIDGPFDFTDSIIYYSGPGTIEFLEADIREYRVRITGVGVHFLTAEASDDENNTHTDTIAIEVMSLTDVETLIKAVWNGMKAKLLIGDIEGALEYFSPFSRTEYEEIFTILSDDLEDIVNGMEEIEYIYVKESIAKYRIKKDEIIDGETHRITYYIHFLRDVYGAWYIDSF